MRTPVVQLLLVPDCSNADYARKLLADCLNEAGLDISVDERVGEFRSPTIAVDGVDVVTGTAVTETISACRLDLPTRLQVLDALRRAAIDPPDRPHTSADYPSRLAVGVASDRIREVSPAARRVHHAILRAFATTGAAPAQRTLRAASGDLSEMLNQLHDHDVIRLDDAGEIRAAYPFSGVPTAHRVAIHGGPTVYAMCAIDALGMAAMLGRDITITSSDPVSGTPVRVDIRAGSAIWNPTSAVVFVGSIASTAGGGCCPPSGGAERVAAAADRCCAVMNFFTSDASAATWQAARPEVSGEILDRGQALKLGIDIFGRLLD